MDQKYYPDQLELHEAYTQKLAVYEAVFDDFPAALEYCERVIKLRGYITKKMSL